MLIKKELIICIFIVIVIIIGDILLQNYTKESLNLINDKLTNIKEFLKEELDKKEEIEENSELNKTENETIKNDKIQGDTDLKENLWNKNEIEKNYIIKSENIKNQIEEINKEWDKRFNILTCFLEHNELEKVKTQLVSISAGLEIGDNEYVYEEINKTIYILEHIRDKESIRIDNIF